MNYLFMFLRYLWGIETKEMKIWTKKTKMCFYATYEELKLKRAINGMIEPFGFYATYEELKRHEGQGNIALVLRFYATYEELKHC